MFDLIVRNGMVLDGTGSPARRLDVGLRGDRIAAVEDLAQAQAREELDATQGLVVPGFIDTHSHSDAYLLIEPSAAGKVYQGVTTEVIGNCGASASPRSGAARPASDWEGFTYPGSWSSVAEYRRLLEAVGPAVNVVALTGHNTLRASVMGYEGRAATASEQAALERLLEQSLDEGSRGLSTGLIYPPGMYATREEIRGLAGVLKRHEAIYTSHMRSESSGLIEALGETAAVGAETGVRVQVSHLKTSGRANWHKIDAALAVIETARATGVEIAADRYPYTASCTDLDVIFPDWMTEGGRDREMARLRDPATRARLRAELLENRAERSWGTIIVGSTRVDNGRFRGQPLETVASQLGVEPVDAALYLIERDDLGTSAFFQGMSEDNLWRILSQPWVMVGSDASVRAPWGPLSHDFPHPRAYGTFPKVLRASLEGRLPDLPEMVRKMTSLPARHFRLKDRGEIRCGAFADLVVLDPGSVRDTATFSQPHSLATGIAHVVVNGRPVLARGALTGARSGCWL